MTNGQEPIIHSNILQNRKNFWLKPPPGGGSDVAQLATTAVRPVSLA